MAVMGLMFPAVLHFTHSEVQYGKSEVALSRFSSCVMLVAYASYLFFQLRSQHNSYNPIDEVRHLTSIKFFELNCVFADQSYWLLYNNCGHIYS